MNNPIKKGTGRAQALNYKRSVNKVQMVSRRNSNQDKEN